MSPIEKFLAAIQSRFPACQPQRLGKETRVPCPAHEDTNPSLDVSEGKLGRVLLCCRSAGCKPQAIVRALGLEMADLFPDDEEQLRKFSLQDRIIREYDYRDEQGKLLYQAVRLHPKDFRQRRPDGSGGWSWDLTNTRRILYRLPELLAASPNATIYIAEGEKDVDALIERGLLATCNPMGAGKWNKLDPSCLEVLRGKRIVLLPDNDQAGRQHMTEVRDSLEPIAACMCMLELPGLPEKGDVSDWFARGNRAEALVSMAQDKLPIQFPDLIPITSLKRGEPGGDWFWHGYFGRQKTTLLSALWKAGKTTLIAHLLKALGHGGHFCGREIKPTKVAYVTEEAEGIWAARRDQLGIGDHVNMLIRPFRRKPGMEDWIELLKHLRSQIARLDIGLVVIDPLTSIWPVDKENDAGLVAEALVPLSLLTDTAGVALIHHLRKGGGDEATASRGSGALPGYVDTILELKRFNPSDREDRRRVLSGWGRYEETPEELVVELTEAGYVAHGSTAQIRKRSLDELILSLLPSHEPGWTWEAINQAIEQSDDSGVKTKTLIDVLAKGVERGTWNCSGRGIKGDPKRYWVSRSIGPSRAARNEDDFGFWGDNSSEKPPD